MSDAEKRLREGKKGFSAITFSRREFLKRTSLAVGGTALASAALAMGCAKPKPSTSPATSTPSATETTIAPPSSSTTTTTSTPPVSSTQVTSTTPTASTTTSAPPVATYSYNPPTTLPPSIDIPNTECKVATDRVYTADHLWVKETQPGSGIVVVGPSSSLEKILAYPDRMEWNTAAVIGARLGREDTFGYIEGYKIGTDLLSPVNGTLLQRNDFLVALAANGKEIEPVVIDPYNSGWMIVVKITSPDELKGFLTPQQYRDLVAKK